MKNNFLKPFATIALGLLSLTACGNDSNSNTPQQPSNPPSSPTEQVAFAKGADIGWLTEMEHDGIKFHNSNGAEQECMSLLKDVGFNAVRLRVWVDPTDGWCGKQDVLDKALRAKALGERIMIDFHYSDWWADPSKQNIPEAWKNHNLNQLKDDVAAHTKDVLTMLKEKNVDVEWIQIGNETTIGMLWPIGKVENDNFAAYAALNNAGYDAAKSIYPDAKCIIHLDRGQELNHFTWMFDGLKACGAKWDVIGMSLYPTDSDWQTSTSSCLSNIKTIARRYGTKVMLCEIGMAWDSTNAAAVMKKMVDGCKADDNCLGSFYWEPEACNGWKDYRMGAFDNDGKPTAALNAFK